MITLPCSRPFGLAGSAPVERAPSATGRPVLFGSPPEILQELSCLYVFRLLNVCLDVCLYLSDFSLCLVALADCSRSCLTHAVSTLTAFPPAPNNTYQETRNCSASACVPPLLSLSLSLSARFVPPLCVNQMQHMS